MTEKCFSCPTPSACTFHAACLNVALSTPTSQPPAAETRMREAAQAIRSVDIAGQTLGEHFELFFAEEEVSEEVTTKALDGLFTAMARAALTQPEPTAQQGDEEEIMTARDALFQIDNLDDKEIAEYPSIVRGYVNDALKALSAQQASDEGKAAAIGLAFQQGREAGLREALSSQQAAGEAEAWICDGLPDEMIEAGIDAWERARDEMRAREESDQPEKHNDWDEGMIVAAIYKAMTLYATPQPTETQRIVAWQPIETAPKDGTHILLLWSYDNGTGPRVSEAFWRNDMPFVNDGCWWFFHGRMFQEPTHWMPLPEAPASGEHLAGERE